MLKCGTSGFVTGVGGLITLPVAIPANIGSVLYVQMRMVAAIAKIGGYDVRSDQVQTLVYMCLTGTAITDVAKQAGIKIGEKMLVAAVKKIPGNVLIKINQRIGFRLLTKFGEKGVINLGKMVPLAGASSEVPSTSQPPLPSPRTPSRCSYREKMPRATSLRRRKSRSWWR